MAQSNRPPRAKRKWEIDPIPAEDGNWYIPDDLWAESMETIRLAGTYLGGGFTVMPVRVKLGDGSYETRGWMFSWENAPTVEERDWLARMRNKYDQRDNPQVDEPQFHGGVGPVAVQPDVPDVVEPELEPVPAEVE